MEKRTTTGLILGKFAPFHKGHQYLLEFAKDRVDKLYVLIYEAREVTDIPLGVRADWIKRIYPDVVVILGNNAPTADDHTPEIMKLQDDYIISMMPEKIDLFFSSEWYGEHVAQALGATNVSVDSERKTVPVSATKVRNGEVPSYEFLHPIVNHDVVRRVVLLGAESTGKSTLAKALAEKYNTIWVPEYGREYWDKNHDENGKLTREQLADLALEHYEREEQGFRAANRIAFVDTCSLTTRQFCLDYGFRPKKVLDFMADKACDRYDMFVLCWNDIPYVDDGTRRGKDIQEETQGKIVADLEKRGIKYTTVVGDLETRLSILKFWIKHDFQIQS